MENFKQTQSISHRLVWTILLISIFFLVEFAGLYLSSQTFLNGLSQLYQTNQVNETLEHTKKIIGSIEENLRQKGRSVTESEASAFFNSAATQAQMLLRQAMQSSNIQSPAFQNLMSLSETSISDLIESLDQLAPENTNVSADVFIALQFSLEAREHLNKAQLELSNYGDQMFSQIYSNRFRPLIVSLALAILLVCIAMILGFRISKHLDLSLKNLLRATSAVSVGDLDVQVPILAPDELGALTDKFNKMTVNIKNSTVSRDYVESILESMLDSVLVVDKAGTILRVNQITSKTFGYDARELMGLSLRDIVPRYTPDRQLAPDNEYLGLTKDGQRFPVSISVSPLENKGQESARSVCVIRDITTLKDFEHQLKKQNVDLANANRELEAFSYSVSHDLRAPLRSVDGFSQALLEDYGEKMDEEAKNHLNRIRAAVQRMGKLIDDLLNLSRITRSQIKPAPVDLSQIVFELGHELKIEEPDRNVDFHIQDHVEAVADPALIRVVLQNLISNSWKYTSKHESANIDFGVTKKDGRDVFYVRDDGAGFDMSYAKKLFGAFQRLHTNQEFPGTGVGLATVQRIIHRHGGSIWAESALEKGTTFYFTL